MTAVYAHDMYDDIAAASNAERAAVVTAHASVRALHVVHSLPAFMTLKRPAAIVRSEYLIDRYLVVFESGVGSHCACEEFRVAQECRHTRESEGRRAAQELIEKRVRSIDGTLVGFGHRIHRNDSRTSKRERTRSLSLIRVR